jgi:hypothetical protein
MNAPATDRDLSADLEEIESNLAEGGRRQIGVTRDIGPAAARA